MQKFFVLSSLILAFSRLSLSSFLIRVDGDEEGDYRVPGSTQPFELRLPQNYSIHQPPPLVNGAPVPIKFSMIIFNVFDIQELKGHVGLEVNLKIFWKDTRLANWTETIEEGQRYTVLNPSLITEVWHPDAFIDHMKEMSQPSLISKAASLRVYPDGSLRYSARMLIVMNCRMNFHYYPADTQQCNVDIKSYAYSTKHVILSWKDKGPELAYKINVHNFDVALDNTTNYLQNTKSASYSAIRFTLCLRRKLSYHIIQTFIPSALFTIVSWLSFLVPPESTPGRMALCVTTLLTLTAMFAAVRQNTPSVSYIKALDVWMVTCIIFVFSVLAEYTTVLKLRSMKEKKKKSKALTKTSNREEGGKPIHLSNQNSNSQLIKRTSFMLEFMDKSAAAPLIDSSRQSPINAPSTSPSEEEKPKPTKYFILACKMEKYTPRILPIIFLLFNIIYWPYLLVNSEYYRLKQDDIYYSIS